MHAIVWLIGTVLQLYIDLLIVGAILSWLIAFGIVNVRNRLVAMVADFCTRLTDPLLRPIRRYIPSLGGIDISPMVLILLIMFIQRLMYEYLG
jgi:YggT family protein